MYAALFAVVGGAVEHTLSAGMFGVVIKPQLIRFKSNDKYAVIVENLDT